MGKQLRKKFELNGLLDLKKYNPKEVFALATFRTRTLQSAKALLQGLYGMDLEFPLLSPNDLVVGKNRREEDLLLRAEDSSVRF